MPRCIGLFKTTRQYKKAIECDECPGNGDPVTNECDVFPLYMAYSHYSDMMSKYDKLIQENNMYADENQCREKLNTLHSKIRSIASKIIEYAPRI